jgi:hypothetical protein
MAARRGSASKSASTGELARKMVFDRTPPPKRIQQKSQRLLRPIRKELRMPAGWRQACPAEIVRQRPSTETLALPAQAGHEEGAALVRPDDFIRGQHLGHAEVRDFEEPELLAPHPGKHPRAVVLMVGRHHDPATGPWVLDVRLGMTELRLAVMF